MSVRETQIFIIPLKTPKEKNQAREKIIMYSMVKYLIFFQLQGIIEQSLLFQTTSELVFAFIKLISFLSSRQNTAPTIIRPGGIPSIRIGNPIPTESLAPPMCTVEIAKIKERARMSAHIIKEFACKFHVFKSLCLFSAGNVGKDVFINKK